MKSTPINKIIPIIIFVLAFLYLLLGFNSGLNIYDEAITLYGAKLISGGAMPYRDFWTIYAPGEYYFLAGLMPLFDWDIAASRILSLLIFFLTAYLIYTITKKTSSRNFAILAFIAAIFRISFISAYSRSVTTIVLIALLNILLFEKFFRERKLAMLFTCGLLTGLAAFFRHDSGAYIFGASFITIFLFGLREGSPRQFGLVLKYLFMYIAGTAAMFIPLALPFLLNVPIKSLINQLFTVPATVFPEYRAIPHPDPISPLFLENTLTAKVSGFWEGMIFYIPILAIIIFLFNMLKSKLFQDKSSEFYLSILLLTTGLLFLNQARIRSDMEHLYPSMIFTIPLIFLLLKNIEKQKVRNWVTILFLMLFLSFPLAKKAQVVYNGYLSDSSGSLNIEHAQTIRLDKTFADNYRRMVDYIRNNIPTDEMIYSGVTDHSRFLLNDVMLYYLSDRKSGTFYHELHPGVTTKQNIQLKILNDLNNNNVNYLILKETVNPRQNKEILNIKSGSDYLDRYISREFETDKTFGEYTIKMRRTNSQD